MKRRKDKQMMMRSREAEKRRKKYIKKLNETTIKLTHIYYDVEML